MTIREVSERYNIPREILKEYETWARKRAAQKTVGAWQYDDADLERLSLVLSLHEMGFDSREVELYLKLLGQEGTEMCIRDSCKSVASSLRWFESIFSHQMGRSSVMTGPFFFLRVCGLFKAQSPTRFSIEAFQMTEPMFYVSERGAPPDFSGRGPAFFRFSAFSLLPEV